MLSPLTIMNDEITLSTDKYFRVHSYIIPMKNVEFTDEKAILAKLPKKSNISDMNKKLDDMKKRIHGEKFKSINDDHSKIMWTDQYNRSFASNIETPDRIMFNLRADAANDLFLEGNALIQCTRAMCSIFVPTKLSLDMKLFGMKEPGR